MTSFADDEFGHLGTHGAVRIDVNAASTGKTGLNFKRGEREPRAQIVEDLLYALFVKSSVGAVAHKVLQEGTRVDSFAGERYRDGCVVGLSGDGAERTKKIRAPNRRTNIALNVRIDRSRRFL